MKESQWCQSTSNTLS